MTKKNKPKFSPLETMVAMEVCPDDHKSLSLEKLEKYQIEKLKEQIVYAKDKSPFFAEHLKNVDLNEINSYGDLAKIPLMSADDVINDGQAMACMPLNKIARFTTIRSSGTNGPSKQLYFTENDLEKIVHFFEYGVRSMTTDVKRAIIYLPGEATGSIAELLSRSFRRIGIEPYTFGAIRDFKAATEAYLTFEADCVIGLPSQILQLARTSPQLKPKSAFITADYIADSLVKAIEDIWQCEVLSHYGISECGLGVGVECPAYLGYHIRYNDLLFEIIDPDTEEILPYGQYGEVVFSTLNREAMPLIRYRMGDIACIYNEPCECGAILPRISRITGRLCNSIKYKDTYLSINQLDEIIYGIPEVLDYQPELHKDVLKLFVKTEEKNLPKIKDYVTKTLPDVNIEVLTGEGFYTRGTIKRKLIVVE